MLFNTVYAADEILNSENISSPRRVELRNLLLQDCGSCHGMTMQGGLGPALTPEALKNKSRIMLETTILSGRPGTPMPPWDKLLTRAEVSWLVDVLYAGVN
ncbi:MAG: cytochrome c [Gammaproteobacteria bacterium]|nr:cytochrome c [Gammaproteobacteria bacterium]